MSGDGMSDDRVRVAVIGGGRNGEHEVSLASAAAVAGALEDGHDVVRLTVDRAGMWRDDEDRPLGLAGAVRVLQSCDVVVPVVHGRHGEDGTLAALCELAGVPYVGAGVTAGAVAMDKWVTKLVAADLGIATAPGELVSGADVPALLARPWSGALVVKPVSAGSSLGVGLVEHPHALPEALTEAFRHDRRVLVERYVVGRELCVAVLGRPDGSRRVAPIEEVVRDGIFDHATKYSGAADFRIPAALARPDATALERAAVRVFDALGCRGPARVDFFLTAVGPVLNEVNSMPGFTAHSAFPLMFAAAGTAHDALVRLMVADALEQPARDPASGGPVPVGG